MSTRLRPQRVRLQHVRLVRLLLIALLLQQLALAAHACVPPQGTVAAITVAADNASHGHCDETRDAPLDSGLLCAKHCDPDSARAAADGSTPSIAPALLPAATMPPYLGAAPARPCAPIDAPIGDPPPMLRYCTLLI